MSAEVRHLPDEAATLALGARIATELEPGFILHLHGDLGAGKTTFARGLIRALGYHGRVKSPTFTLVEVYKLSRLSLYHFDFYRFRDSREWHESGFSEYFDGDGICLVEWPEKAADELPPPDLDITLELQGPGRRAHVVAHSLAGAQCCAFLTHSTARENSS